MIDQALHVEIEQVINWYMRQGKRYYYRILHKPLGQNAQVRAVMDETLTGNKEAASERLRHELQYLATRGEFPLYLRVGVSATDANPSEITVFPQQKRAGVAGIGSIGQNYGTEVAGIGVGGGIYGTEYIGLLQDREKLKYDIELLKYKQETQGNQWLIDLCNTEVGKNLISGIMNIAAAFAAKGNPASLAGFNTQPQNTELPQLHHPQHQTQAMPHQHEQEQEEITLDEVFNNYLQPLDNNLQKLKPDMTIITLLGKLLELSDAAVKGDQLSKFKINTALNNL